MPPQAQPELKKYLEKQVEVQLNGNKKVTGQLRGYDVFLNIVLDNAVEVKENNEKSRMGMCVIRGNQVVMVEALEQIGGGGRGGPGGYQGGFRGPPGGGFGGPPPGGPPMGGPPGM